MHAFMFLIPSHVGFHIKSQAAYMTAGQIICLINDFASYDKEKEANCAMNFILVLEKFGHRCDANDIPGELCLSADEAFRYVEQMLCSRVSLLEEQLLTLPAEEASVILMWVLGYHQFEKLGADRRNAERELYSL